MKTLSVVGAWIGIRVLLSLAALMPKRGKRLMLITALFSYLSRAGVFRDSTLDRLNTQLSLAGSVAALRLPEELCGTIWCDAGMLADVQRMVADATLHDGVLSYDDARAIADVIVPCAPKWLKYERTDMVSDILAMFYSQPLHVAA